MVRSAVRRRRPCRHLSCVLPGRDDPSLCSRRSEMGSDIRRSERSLPRGDAERGRDFVVWPTRHHARADRVGQSARAKDASGRGGPPGGGGAPQVLCFPVAALVR